MKGKIYIGNKFIGISHSIECEYSDVPILNHTRTKKVGTIIDVDKNGTATVKLTKFGMKLLKKSFKND